MIFGCAISIYRSIPILDALVKLFVFNRLTRPPPPHVVEVAEDRFVELDSFRFFTNSIYFRFSGDNIVLADSTFYYEPVLKFIGNFYSAGYLTDGI